MMINLQNLIPGCVPCIVDADDILYICQEELRKHESLNDYLLLKTASRKKPIILKRINYGDDKLTSDIMQKVTFAINAGRTATIKEPHEHSVNNTTVPL